MIPLKRISLEDLYDALDFLTQDVGEAEKESEIKDL